MTLPCRALLYSAIGAGALACSNPTTSPVPRATVVVQRDTVVATSVSAGLSTWMRFSLPVAIHNTGARSLTFHYCASIVEASMDREWDAVWSPVCSGGSAAMLDIAPGETRQVAVNVEALIDGPGGPRWGGATVSGTYRYGAGLMITNRSGHIPVVPSNTFVLKGMDQTPRHP